MELIQDGVVVGFQTIKSGLRETLAGAPGKATVRVFSGELTPEDQAFEETREVTIVEGESLKVDVQRTPDKR